MPFTQWFMIEFRGRFGFSGNTFGFQVVAMAAAENMEVSNAREMGLCNARDLPDRRRKFWTVLVQALRKDDMKVGRSGKRYQGYVLTDMQGTIVGAVSFDPHFIKFNRLLEPYNRYYMSNAWVRDANPDYQVSDYNQSWTLTNYTHVELVEDPIPYTVPCDFNFRRFSELPPLIDHAQRIDLRCLLVHSLPTVARSSGSKTKQYVVIDEDGIAMMIRAWDDLVDNKQNQVTSKLPEPTVLVFTNVKVTTRNGFSLATQTNTSVFYNPPLDVGPSMLEWYTRNSEYVTGLIKNETYQNMDMLLPLPRKEDITPIAEAMEQLDQMRVAWVCGKLHLLPAQEKFWYPACANCYKSVNEHITWEATCNSCRVKGTYVPRCRVDFYLNDSTDTMCVTLFGEKAEKLIGYSAVELKASAGKHWTIEKEIEARVHKKTVTCFVKCYDRTFQGNNVRSHTIVHMYSHSAPSAIDDGNAQTLLLKGDSNKALDDAENSAPEQLFSPTTKKVLEEISTNASPIQPSSILIETTKRPLFVTKEDMSAVGSSVHVVDVHDASKSDPDGVGSCTNDDGNSAAPCSSFASPSKKLKNKVKEC